jgi:hypothetical protein
MIIQARIALAAKQRIRHRDRSLVMPGHQINEQPVKGRSLDRLKSREVSRVQQPRHRGAFLRGADLHGFIEPA